MNLNYTSICLYCGEIYLSNKSTSKYCCRNHNSMYNSIGSQIDNTILNCEGVYISYYVLLSKIYKSPIEPPSWQGMFSYDFLVNDLSYDGPLPLGSEILLVSSFLIRKSSLGYHNKCFYFIKPFHLLTKNEKARSIIIKGSFHNR